MTGSAPPPAALAATATIQSDHPEVAAFAARAVSGAEDEVDAAVRLFNAVRDAITYDPYTCVITPEALAASTTLATRRAWCVPKAILLAASCRAVGIPARLGFADVRNHLSTPRLAELMGTDVYAWHGHAALWLGGRWVKATPAFNARPCERFGLRVVTFDGREDSLLHPLDARGRAHLEYVADRGEHDDTPVDAIRATFEELYPRLLAESALPRSRRVRDAFADATGP